jgi:esterase/lipase superfamily enzyme
MVRFERFGRRGPALVYVPTSGGDETEFARYGMARDCEPWTASGRLQVFSIDGLGPETLWNDALSPRERIAAYARLERHVAGEVLPWVGTLAPDGPPTVVGCSYGAFVAANLLFKVPERVAGACGLGGVYGLWHRLDGYHDDDVYFHTPLEYLPRLEDPEILGAIRRTRGMALFGAASDEWVDSTRRLAEVLRDRRLPHSVEIWPEPADHRERWWRLQLRQFLESRFG